MKNILIIAVIVLVLGAGAFFYFNKYGGGNTTMPATNSGSNSTTEASPNNIVIKNYIFTPSALTVKAGTTVTWTNNDSVAHSIKSAAFNSSILNTGDTFKFTFNTAGTYNYNCGIHPTMTGTVIVQ